MSAIRIAHVAYWTKNLQNAVVFWEKYLGAKAGTIYCSQRRSGFASCFLKLGDGPTVELMTGPWITERNSKPESEGMAHLAIALGSEAAVDECALKMEKDGLLVASPRRTGDGYYEAVVRDYDGNLIEITK